MADDAVLRIGEVARRTGVSVSTLRAWERRYELLDPERTEGGHRLYREADVQAVRTMQQLLDQGWSAGAAANEVRTGTANVTPLHAAPAPSGDVPVDGLVTRLRDALDAFDSAAANLVVDDLLARLDVASALERVLFPVLRWVGEGWRADPRMIAREHFASNLLRPRLLRLLRSNRTGARVAVAAAPADEEHDLGLLGAAVVLSEAGWAVRYLGARTPVAVLAQATAEADADIALVATPTEKRAAAFLAEVRDTPALGGTLLVLGGAGFAGVEVDDAVGLNASGTFRELPRQIDEALLRRREQAG